MDKLESNEEGVDASYATEIPTGELIIAELKSITGAQVEIEFYIRGVKQQGRAVSTAPVHQSMIGRQAVISFLNADVHSPVILGLLHSPLYELLDNFEITPITSTEVTQAVEVDSTDIDVQKTSAISKKSNTENTAELEQALPVIVDGKHICIKAEQQLQLQCGESSITLTQEGKILIRGKYLLNRASGINRIIGGSVQVN